MDNNLDLKVAKTSRAAIDSLQNSKHEFQSMIDKMDKEVSELSQEVRTPNGTEAAPSISRINKLKLHRKRLNDLLMLMEEKGGAIWEQLQPEAQQAYDEAMLAKQ